MPMKYSAVFPCKACYLTTKRVNPELVLTLLNYVTLSQHPKLDYDYANAVTVAFRLTLLFMGQGFPIVFPDLPRFNMTTVYSYDFILNFCQHLNSQEIVKRRVKRQVIVN